MRDGFATQLIDRMDAALAAFHSTADQRFSAHSRRFSIFRPLSELLVPLFEASIARSHDTAAAWHAKSALVSLQARDLGRCEIGLCHALKAALQADDSAFAYNIQAMRGAVLDALSREPARRREPNNGGRFLTASGRRPARRAREAWGSAKYCVMCERLVEARDPERVAAQRVEPGAKLSGNYCWQHKPATGKKLGGRCNVAYRRGLERLGDFQFELWRLYSLLDGRAPEDGPTELWDRVLRSLSWRSLSIDDREQGLRRLASLATHVSARHQLNDLRKQVLMMTLAGTSARSIAHTVGKSEREVMRESARRAEWLPDEVGNLLSEQDDRERRMVALWCSK
jgi:hypothetical protein